MTKLIVKKIDRFINYLTLSFIICGGMIIHILTALTINNYYGFPWGYVAFSLPGLAEIYLSTIQISESMYNYMVLLFAFLSITAILGAVRYVTNALKSRLEAAAQS